MNKRLHQQPLFLEDRIELAIREFVNTCTQKGIQQDIRAISLELLELFQDESKFKHRCEWGDK